MIVSVLPSVPLKGVYITEQVATAPLPTRLQVPPLLKVPPVGGLWVKVTVPDGVIAVSGEMSVTVALQVEGVLTGSGVEHDTEVEVSLRLVTVCPSNGITCE